MTAKSQLLGLAMFAALAVLTVPAIAGAEEFQDVHECDRYAAHPSDPHRWAAGVEDSDIIPGPAVKFCREAVDEYPETPRFAFQLGRALWAANRIDEGTDVFLTLEEQVEYGPVYAYLADAYMYGLGSIEVDEELGLALYQIAAEEGFAPANEVLAALTGIDEGATVEGPADSREPIAQVMEPQAEDLREEVAFNPGMYTQPRMVGSLFSGDLSQLEPDGVGKTNYAGLSNAHIYLASFHKEFGGTVNFKDQSCVKLYDPRVTKNLEAKVVRLLYGDSGMDLETSLNQTAERGWEMMADLLMDMSQGGMGSLIDTQQNLIELGENGAIDAARLIAQHGCQSETAQRVYANIRAYAFGQEGVLSPEEAARQEKIKEQKAKEAERNHQKSLRTNAATSCQAQWKKKPMCECIVEALDQSQITEGEWKMIGNEFKSVVSLSRRYEGLSEELRTCRS